MSDSWKRILKNILIFAVILAALIAIVLALLNKYTQHDSAITVPDVTTLTVDEAAPFLEKKDLRYKVVDSIRIASMVPGAIIEQKPVPGAHVKQNRIVFLTINATSEERIAVPDVKDCSQRQAEATLKSNGFCIRDVEFVPSEFRDLVLGVNYNGKSIPAGFKLPKGSFVTLIVGQSSNGEAIQVPSMHGLSLEEAVETAHSKSLNIGIPHYDVTPANSEAAKYYKVYRQDPITGSSTSVGKKIELWMTTDIKLLEKAEEIYIPEDSLDTEEY
jgi:eukaryotic-like serine/threonine-protein kinase